jgi:hypothetical protein
MAIEQELPASGAPAAATPTLVAAQGGLSAGLKEILEFSERENQKHRDYFQMLYKWTAGSLTVIVIVIGGLVAFVGWHTIDDIRKQAQAATQQEIVSIRQQSRDTLAKQTGEIQQQIAQRLDEEFKTEAIRQTVQSAAKQQTAGALLPIITTEVRSQVNAGVKAEQQTVQRSLIQQVHQSVEDLKPTINKRVDETVGQSVTAAVSAQVDSQIAPRLKQLENNAQISTLINQAESGDGPSFDILIRMAGDPQVPVDARNLALKVARSIVASHNQGFYSLRQFLDKKTEQEEVVYLQDADPQSRQAAVDSLGANYWKAHLDQLFSIMTMDNSIEVRRSAYMQFKGVTQLKSDALDNFTATEWWRAHRNEFVK